MSFPDQTQPTGDQPGGGAIPGQPSQPSSSTPQVEHPEVVTVGDQADQSDQPNEAVEQPAKVMRIGSMIKLLLEEVRQSESDLDEPRRRWPSCRPRCRPTCVTSWAA